MPRGCWLPPEVSRRWLRRPLPNFAFCAWLGLLGPAGIPAPILGMLNPATNVALRHPETAELEAHLERELSRWADLARHVHLKVASYSAPPCRADS